MDMTTIGEYCIVSPVKDEESFVEHTLRSVVGQKNLPLRWIIVDDGSVDGTRRIIERYARAHKFIRLIQTGRTATREPGTAVINAFNLGYASLSSLKYDFIIKLDCDLLFEADYFERLLGRFGEDSELGIASGVYQEQDITGKWEEIRMPTYHAAGACKIIRKKCFDEIGGFVCARGWDTVDEIKAMCRGWKTRHFADLQMKHLKPEGSGIGALRTCALHGEVFYRTGGDLIFFICKLINRAFYRPPLIGAGAVAFGYLKTMLYRERLLVNAEEAALYKKVLRQRLFNRLG